jgi:hypothetical protein
VSKSVSPVRKHLFDKGAGYYVVFGGCLSAVTVVTAAQEPWDSSASDLVARCVRFECSGARGVRWDICGICIRP